MRADPARGPFARPPGRGPPLGDRGGTARMVRSRVCRGPLAPAERRAGPRGIAKGELARPRVPGLGPKCREPSRARARVPPAERRAVDRGLDRPDRDSASRARRDRSRRNRPANAGARGGSRVGNGSARPERERLPGGAPGHLLPPARGSPEERHDPDHDAGRDVRVHGAGDRPSWTPTPWRCWPRPATRR